MSQATALRSRAEALAARYPPLMAAAQHLASTVVLGEHGRRRSGMGDEFWQYRAAQPGDEARTIDWRRSARSDAAFVKEKEWQAAQSIVFWVDATQSMQFRSDKNLRTKGDTAALVALAASVLLVRGGERVGLSNAGLPPRSGTLQLMRLSNAMNDIAEAEYGAPDLRGLTSHAQAVFISDFLGDISTVEHAMGQAADRGVGGVLLQILDPQEEAFPFDGRTVFQSVGGGVQHETLSARDLRSRYLDRLAERKARLADLARVSGWQYHCHHTTAQASHALLWLYQALERTH